MSGPQIMKNIDLKHYLVNNTRCHREMEEDGSEVFQPEREEYHLVVQNKHT